ncbi:MAG: polysaccharide biosynthesis/export family protein [Bacteroidia bacterium]|nr:polysaccharide biosynthesis/export family protein [Bacteroidia bacterium]
MYQISYLYLLGMLVLTSCARQNFYSMSSPNSYQSLLLSVEEQTPRIRPHDKISVSIWGHEDLSIGSVYGIYNSNEVFGKWILVDKQGHVQLPKLGATRLGGLSIQEAREKLERQYEAFVVEPIIDVKVHSHEVSIIGQVISPGNYPLYEGKNTISYFIAAAGGTDFHAKLTEVKLSRQNTTYELDLTRLSPDVLNNIALLPGDVIYIPTRQAKLLEKKSPVLLALASVATTVFLFLSR